MTRKQIPKNQSKILDQKDLKIEVEKTIRKMFGCKMCEQDITHPKHNGKITHYVFSEWVNSMIWIDEDGKFAKTLDGEWH